ncbi:MAG: hypothetical protein KAG70_05100, partial [Alcanivorax sp.]|nr:hypothetical protein [Alcanivorax sp.]
MLRALTFLCFLSTAPMACASLPTWVGVEIQSFAQTKSNPEIVYATGGGVLFKSIDRGKSWGPIKTPKNSGYVLAVPERHDHLVIWSRYSAKLEGQLFPLGYMESKDGGRTWAWNAIPVDVKRIAQNDQLSDFLIDQIEYGGAWWVVIGGLLLRSIDEGANWEINTEKVQSRIHILHTPILSYRLSGNTLYRSRDRG